MKRETNRNPDQPVTVTITPNELAVIGHVLYPYAQFLRRAVSPSAKRGASLMVIENLRRRIVTTRLQEDQQFPITVGELSVIDAAFASFIANLRHLFPKSQERDDTIKACEGLQAYLATSLAASADEADK